MKVLLVNPWIYDFAAFDLWARPLGLLYLADMLRASGVELRLIDCLDRAHPASEAPRRRQAWPAATGQWRREPVPTPQPLAGIPRHFARYGLPVSAFETELLAGPAPDLVMVTSGMTYWYPGVHLAIDLVRRHFPKAPVMLGGHYASLCAGHARKTSGADLVLPGPGEERLLAAVKDFAGASLPEAVFQRPWHAFRPLLDLYPKLESAPLLTSRGCPLRCPYCASGRLYERFDLRSPEDVLDEIEDRVLRLGIRHFAFFDDALLIRAEEHIMPILEGVIRRGWDIRFHAPNGLHVGRITPELAVMMRRAGFETLRLGVESLQEDRQDQLGRKYVTGEFESAMDSLRRAGFGPTQIGTYILFGLPGQDPNEVMETARAVAALGGRPHLAEYSPLPGTPMWEAAVRSSPFDLENEPLYQNNSFLPCRPLGYSLKKIWEIRRMATEGGEEKQPPVSQT